MKNLILVMFMCLLMNILQAQENFTQLTDFSGIGIGNNMGQDANNLVTDGTYVYGYTNQGAIAKGTLFKIKISDGGVTIIHHFDGTPRGTLNYHNGYLYGAVYYQYGTNHYIYKVKPDGSEFTKLYTETTSSPILSVSVIDDTYMYGAISGYVARFFPYSSDMVMADFSTSIPPSPVIKIGNEIYGIGGEDKGKVYKAPCEFTWGDDVSTTLVTFTGSNGEAPYGRLFYDGEFLYGTTILGGDNSVGVIYKVKPDGTGFAKIHDCAVATGSKPYASLISDGTYLYGTASEGGDNTYGVVYKIKPDGTDYTVLHHFTNLDGATPKCALVIASGYLWGNTTAGTAENNGAVFKIASDGTGYTNIVNYSLSKGGIKPGGSVTKIGSDLYGMATNLNGSNGIIYKIDLNKNYQPSIVYNLPNRILNNDDWVVQSSSFEYDGTFFYGVHQGGLFKIKPDGTSYTLLKTFAIGGASNFDVVSLHLEGNVLYGMTGRGGTNNWGYLYKINTDGLGFEIIQSFTMDDAQQGTLVSDGTYLYGMTLYGGIDGNGTIFRVKMSDNTFETIHEFPNIAGSATVPLGLTITGGYLYIISYGGTTTFGALSRINLSNLQYQLLYSFDYTKGEGDHPAGTLATDGTFIYGLTTVEGANNKGVAFKYHIATNKYYKLIDFDGTNGWNPRAGDPLMFDGTFIYATTHYGGKSNYGTVFKYNVAVPDTYINITTQAAGNIEHNTATANGNITDLGLSNPTQHGFCWSTQPNPTINNSKVELGEATTTGAYSASITGLSLATTYYVRAYATNASGTKYGAQVSFTTKLFLGAGTAGDPYQIRNYDDLRHLSANSTHWVAGLFYIQTADIDATPSQNGRLLQTYINAIGTTTANFSATYNGNNHTISNLKIGGEGSSFQGLFGSCNNASISNLGIINGDIQSYEVAGGIAGSMNGGSIANCFFTGSVRGTYKLPNNRGLGGLVGIANCTITNCYAIASVSSVPECTYATTGGLVGARNGTITNCYFAGSVSGNAQIQPFIAINNGGSSANSFWDVEVDGITGNVSGADNFGATGKSTSEMKTIPTFTDASWDFVGETTNGTNDYWKWDGLNNQGYPFFSWQVFTYTWNGTGTWDVTANWDKGSIPVSNSNIIVNSGELIINQNITVNDLTINPNAKLTLNSGYSLTVNGNFTIKSNAVGSGSFVDNGGTLIVSGTTTVERHALQNRTHYFSSVVADAKSNSFAGVLGLYKFDAAASTPAWATVAIDNTNVLTPGIGYALKYTENVPNIKFVGALNTGDVQPVISHNAQGYNWNLVGNPYPSAIDWKASGWTKDGIADATYIRTGANSVATYSGNVGTNGGSRYIAIGQAFWVRTSATSPVLKFTNSVRVHDAVNMLKGGNTHIFRMLVETTGYSDEIAIALTDNASNGIDNLDAYKMFSNGSFPELYSLVDNKEMVINQLSASEMPSQVNLGVKSSSIGTYSLRANLSEFGSYSGAIILVDNLLSKRIDLRTSPTYAFTSDVGSVNNRFAIDFAQGVTSISEAKASKTLIFATQNQIHVRFAEATSAQIDVVDLLGRILISKKVNNADNTLLSNGLSGVYLVRVISNGMVETKQVFIGN